MVQQIGDCRMTHSDTRATDAAPEMASPYFVQPEAARFLRLSERTLERWRLQGQGPLFSRFGRRIVYPKDELVAWARSRTVSSTSAADAAA